jgi:hypothetical protein
MEYSKLNASQVSVDGDVKNLLIEQAKNLLEQIQEDIRTNQKLSNQTKENCEAIVKRSQREYDAYLIMFLEETNILLNNARRKPILERKPIQQAWQHAFNIHVEKCKKIVGPILHVLNAIAAEDIALKQKYRLYLAGGVLGTAIVGGSVITFCVHLCRVGSTCACFACTPTGVICIIGGICLTAALTLGLFCGCISTAKVRKIRANCSEEVKLFLVKAFPDILNDSQRPVTASELEKVLQDTINDLKINDEIWSHDETLESLCRQADANLKFLREKS